MDVDKLAEAIISRIEHDRAIHKSSLVEEIQRAMNPTWSQPMPSMVEVVAQSHHLVNHYDLSDYRSPTSHLLSVLSDGTTTWECVSLDGVRRRFLAAVR